MWSLWVERHVLVNVFAFFGILFLYQGIVIPAISPKQYSHGTLVVLGVSVVGLLIPQFIWCRLAAIRRAVKKLAQEDMVIWEQLYYEIMSRPCSKIHQQEQILRRKPYSEFVW
jgi:hypothetical protein